MESRKKFDLSSAALHMLAMFFMLLDHLWATVVPGNGWLTCVGRLAFPIFAFLLVEGYCHTRNLKKYMLRLLTGAVISEIPFNLMLSARFFYPIHQNVLWTFLLSLGLLHWVERAKDAPVWRKFLRWVCAFCTGMILGTLTMVDYYGYGVAMVLVFYFCRKNWWQLKPWLNRLILLFGLYWINVEMMGGLVYEFPLFGGTLVIHQQGFALLGLIPIWLYRGRQGLHSPAFRYFCYGFYPAHMLLLVLLRQFL